MNASITIDDTATTKEPANWWFMINNTLKSYRVRGNFHANSPRAITQMAIAGVGIARCPLYAVASHLHDGSLKLLFEDKEASKIGLYAVYPPNRHLTAKMRALIDFLAEFYNKTQQ